MKFFYYFSIVTCTFLSTFGNLKAQTYVENAVNTALTEKGSASCVLVFEPLLLKNKINTNLTKAEKGNLAFSLLTNHLKGKTEATTQFLKQNQVKYRINILSSTINVLNCPAYVLYKLQTLPEIKAILANYSFRGFKDEADIISSNQRIDYTWGLMMTETNIVQEMGYRGQGAVVGGNDTGFDWTHPAIQQRYRGLSSGTPDHSYNWHDAIHENSPLSDPNQSNPCGLSIKTPCDDHSHGTHTMGTMVGSIAQDNIIGMAPDAQWIATRNMERGNGSLLSYLETLDWYLAPTDSNDVNPDPEKAPDVINNSWYCSEEEGCNIDNWNLMQVSVANLKAAGIVVVASAGNSGPRCETIAFVPGMLEEAFVVGATNQVDTIAGFSSRGAVSADSSMRMKPDISAPGVGVYSSVLNHGYSYFSGTSMAGPHVAGLVALMVGANPKLAGQVDTIQEIIKRTADPKTFDQDCSGLSGLAVPNPIYGYGRINSLRAVQEALKYQTSSTVKASTSNLQMFPNPATSSIMLQRNNTHSSIIEIYDLHGKKVISCLSNAEFTHIDVSTLHTGIYFVKLNQGNKIEIGKFIKI